MFQVIIALLSLVGTAASLSVPEENRTKGTPPDARSLEAGAEQLMDAIAADDPDRAADFFFPAPAFDLVKDMALPARYYKKLVGYYHDDIRAEHRRFKKGTWKVVSVTLGQCRWQEKGTEGNKLPYWSCRGNFVTASDGTRTRRFEIKVLINWGPRWYVTHLGPIRR